MPTLAPDFARIVMRLREAFPNASQLPFAHFRIRLTNMPRLLTQLSVTISITASLTLWCP